ncbi:MAG: transposase [Roseofilum sp. SBFL]|uniref:RNA-guided endonuclease InsQ/TnpB family protein n=2 Tax=Roseofilum TaxID=1233426 RepID=UPI001B2CE70C|nr:MULTISPECIES: transposase [unclassified Roseofilum]MBP0012909.1 transposase [Roseofilum sp. SID3]MBP0026576.1 transposase [Roseofilum sp. SID2]MBP0037373.1 transposase [Roseofilum sp. SID1]MBP0040754.1 transposase [Roseofilum sp. SBFL]
MKQTLTIVCQLNPTPEQAQKLDKTLVAFAEACNYVNETVNPQIKNKNRIQAETYKEIRSQFGLSANLAVRVCARVAANRKVGKPVKSFKSTSADYDARIFSYREKDQSASLTTVDGRLVMPMVLGNYQIGKLKGHTPTSATLCKHRDGLFYLHVQVKDETPEPINDSGVKGVDLGRTDLAISSEGERFSGNEVKAKRDRFALRRASIQWKGTKSSKRLLKRLSGREKRYQTWVNHNISKRIVECAYSANQAIALEDLTGIRERTNQQLRSKTERRRSNSWAFYQLRMFIDYKAAAKGVPVVLVNPAYTSQTCHRCLHIHPEKGKSYRSGKTFKCGYCGWKGDADLNGANNIKRLGGVVTRLESASLLSCSLLDRVTG